MITCLGERVPEDHIITVALDDDLNVACRDPAELSKYIRSKVTDQEGKDRASAIAWRQGFFSKGHCYKERDEAMD